MKLINVHRIVYLKIYKQEREINDDFIESNKKNSYTNILGSSVPPAHTL